MLKNFLKNESKYNNDLYVSEFFWIDILELKDVL